MCIPFLKASSPNVEKLVSPTVNSDLMTYPVVKHPDDGGTLVVRDEVEDIVHLAGVPHLHLDVVGCNNVITD